MINYNKWGARSFKCREEGERSRSRPRFREGQTAGLGPPEREQRETGVSHLQGGL